MVLIRSFESVALPLALAFVVGALPRAQGATVEADFVFFVDDSGSMADEIRNVADGLSAFATGLAARNVDARFAVVTFGTTPTLVLQFTADAMALETRLRTLPLPGGIETGLEAIRMALGASPKTLMDATGGNGVLVFRPNARKDLILVTDEDSDLPIFAENRFPGQSMFPVSCPLALPWQQEVDATARAVVTNEAFINLLVEESGLPDDVGVECQYGDYDADVSDPDLLNFDPAGTLSNLEANGFDGCLEAQVLRSGLIGRSFDIARVADPVFVANFFEAKIGEVCAQAELLTYGNGTPGKLGVPGLSFSDLPRRGTRIEAIIVSSTDVDRIGCLLIGPQEASVSAYGIEFLVQSTREIPLVVPANDGVAPDELRIGWRIPATVDVCGLTQYIQWVQLDDATRYSASRGIRATIGN